MVDPLPESASEYLLRIDAQWSEYDNKSEDALLRRGDGERFIQFVEAQAGLLIRMSKELELLEQSGVHVPREIAGQAAFLGERAQEGLDRMRGSKGTSFFIQQLLHNPEDDVDTPSKIAKLATRYQSV